MVCHMKWNRRRAENKFEKKKKERKKILAILAL